MGKAPEAFRTISEVSSALDTPAHVLRFWETKFTKVKPVKRAGGRRYYRPFDIALLAGIKHLLHERGMTVKGVQKLLREEGAGYVVSHAPEKFRPVASVTQIPANTGRKVTPARIPDAPAAGHQPTLFPDSFPAPAPTTYPMADSVFLCRLARADPDLLASKSQMLRPHLQRLRQIHKDM